VPAWLLLKYEFKIIRFTQGEGSAAGAISIDELATQIGLPTSEIKLVMINSRPVHPGAKIEPGDSVALFPKEYPFFADWMECWQEYTDSFTHRQDN